MVADRATGADLGPNLEAYPRDPRLDAAAVVAAPAIAKPRETIR